MFQQTIYLLKCVLLFFSLCDQVNVDFVGTEITFSAAETRRITNIKMYW